MYYPVHQGNAMQVDLAPHVRQDRPAKRKVHSRLSNEREGIEHSDHFGRIALKLIQIRSRWDDQTVQAMRLAEIAIYDHVCLKKSVQRGEHIPLMVRDDFTRGLLVFSAISDGTQS